MIGALGTTLFFAITPVFAHRAAHLLGSLSANFWRLLLATVLLGAWAHVAGRGLGGGAFVWFFLGGLVGFGVGGVAMFQSLPRLGASLSTLVVQCGSALAAALVEWLWLGATVTPLQAASIVATLGGVAIGLMPRSLPRLAPAIWRSGLAWAALSAVAQGAGAVISRKAFTVAAALHQPIDPGTAAYERALGGVLVAVLALGVAGHLGRPAGASLRRAWPWVCGNALTGPVLGVTCYQWALRATPAALVQPLVAAAPLLTVPLAIWIDHAPRPRSTYYLGAGLAVLGVTGLLLGR